MKKAELLAEQARLFSIANDLARKHWGVDYTGTLVLVNRPWRRRFACFRFSRHDDSVREIRMSAHENAASTEEEVRDALLHELVHWRLHMLGLPARDTDEEFIAECIRVGAMLSEAGNAQKALQLYTQKRKFDEAV
ncbi:hypothetical protein [Paenibacillus polymyxa]|uniref:hypothetical protein n=1 Tax=Paenibacillus polymyxa TaxID=1406 RepID=UPI0006C5CDDE|nr:hypothetical protein [Paenibacillus polymyxa]KOS00439.1 hypothetical protein AM598_22840 [Paenibacillus polymyxa]